MLGIILLFVVIMFIITDADVTVPDNVKFLFRNIFLLTILLTFIYIVKVYL